MSKAEDFKPKKFDQPIGAFKVKVDPARPIAPKPVDAAYDIDGLPERWPIKPVKKDEVE